MVYDLVIIGSGFAGLAAAKKATDKGLNFCIISKDAGATLHFSGAFDVIDPRWQEPELAPTNYPSLRLALDRFILGHPNHIYARLAESSADFSERLIAEIESFFDFYNIPVISDDKMLLAFGSSGRVKPTGFALNAFGLKVAEIEAFQKALVVDSPWLKDYPGMAICEQLRKYFSSVTPVSFADVTPNRISPLASLLMLMDQKDSFDKLKNFLKIHLGDARVVLMPPILGNKNYLQNHQELESELGVRVVEFLSVLPSTSGLRLQNHFQEFFQKASVNHVQGKVVQFQSSGKKIHGVTVNKDEEEIEIQAKTFLLASGKFIGGGIKKDDRFEETIFQLPLQSFEEPLTPNVHVTSLITVHALQRQPFLNIGIFTNAQGDPTDQRSYEPFYDNLKSCGHVLSGFDFTRDRCGFGLSLATAMQCF